MAVITPQRREDFFDENGEPTLRFVRFLESLTDQANSTASEVDTTLDAITFSTQMQQLRKELDGLPEFTMDTEGFTMDATEFTMDKVIA